METLDITHRGCLMDPRWIRIILDELYADTVID